MVSGRPGNKAARLSGGAPRLPEGKGEANTFHSLSRDPIHPRVSTLTLRLVRCPRPECRQLLGTELPPLEAEQRHARAATQGPRSCRDSTGGGTARTGGKRWLTRG